MIKSMTGYGRARRAAGLRDISVEIKSVNHRYFELYARIPRSYMQIEDYLRNYLSKSIARGKVEVCVNVDDSNTDIREVKINKALFEAYLNTLDGLADEYGLEKESSAGLALRLPDVIKAEKDDPDTEALWNDVRQVLDEALEEFNVRRAEEGSVLAADIISKCGEINDNLNYIKGRAAELSGEYEKRLRSRIEDMLGGTEIDEQRLMTEVAIMADKTSVDEELVRLDSHLAALKEMFDTGTSNGKKMDFIIQELNRETNTISSKIGDIETTKRVIEIKALIEKIREQIQNIE